jgi:hypothetical protein
MDIQRPSSTLSFFTQQQSHGIIDINTREVVAGKIYTLQPLEHDVPTRGTRRDIMDMQFSSEI